MSDYIKRAAANVKKVVRSGNDTAPQDTPINPSEANPDTQMASVFSFRSSTAAGVNFEQIQPTTEGVGLGIKREFDDVETDVTDYPPHKRHHEDDEEGSLGSEDMDTEDDEPDYIRDARRSQAPSPINAPGSPLEGAFSRISLDLNNRQNAGAPQSFSRADKLVFEEIAKVSFEAVLPLSWTADVVQPPYEAFGDNTFLQTMNNSGARCVNTAISCARHVRWRNEYGHHDAPFWFRRLFDNLNRLMLSDIGINHKAPEFLPVLTWCIVDSLAEEENLTDGLKQQLAQLEQQWATALQANSPGEVAAVVDGFYGVLIAKKRLLLVSWIPGREFGTGNIRTIAYLDFAHDGSDAWNAISIVIFFVHARNVLMDALAKARRIARQDPQGSQG